MGIIERSIRQPVAVTVVVLLLIPATLQSLDQIDRSRLRVFDSHGDRRNDLLDDLEARRRMRAMLRR